MKRKIEWDEVNGVYEVAEFSNDAKITIAIDDEFIMKCLKMCQYDHEGSIVNQALFDRIDSEYGIRKL